MKRYLIYSIIFFCFFAGLQAQNESYLARGIAYYLIGDYPQAQAQLNSYFRGSRQVQVKRGFDLLIQQKPDDAVTQFSGYLEINHRSPLALVGISLATANMKNTNSIQNLQRALRLNSQFIPAHLGIGFEYMKARNYPLAERHLNRAYRFSKVREIKIILSDLYFKMGEPKVVLDLVKREADSSPDNYYFNYLTAKAYYTLNQIDNLKNYVDAALEVNPSSKDARLLKAKYLLLKNDPKGAKSLIEDMTFDYYNKDYAKTLAHALVKLRDRKAQEKLYEVFSQDRWDREINLYLTQHYYETKKGNIQNWITRSLLSGNTVEKLREIFAGKFRLPTYDQISFFDVKAIKWLSEKLVLFCAVRRSGERGKLYLLDIDRMRIVNSFNYQGDFKAVFISPDRKRVVFASTYKNEKTYVYTLERTGRGYTLRPIRGMAFNMPDIVVGFNQAATLLYFTDKSIKTLGFESPFAVVSQIGRKRPIYPRYPFPIYQYNYRTSRLGAINDETVKQSVPIPVVRKYYSVVRAMQESDRIRSLVERGQELDLTSNEIIKIYFGDNTSSFIIYLSDLKNAFQAQIYNSRNKRVTSVDATMFLGKKKYAQLELVKFNPQKSELMVVTKDKNRNLINYNYKTHLHNKLSKKTYDFHYDPKQDAVYVLQTRSKKLYFTETSLEIIFLDPYSRKKVRSRRDLSKIVFCCDDLGRADFTTYNGEKLRLTEDYDFEYIGPSMEGCIHEVSPSNRTTAAFINGRLFIIK